MADFPNSTPAHKLPNPVLEWVIVALIWFADFVCPDDDTRPGGNHG